MEKTDSIYGNHLAAMENVMSFVLARLKKIRTEMLAGSLTVPTCK